MDIVAAALTDSLPWHIFAVSVGVCAAAAASIAVMATQPNQPISDAIFYSTFVTALIVIGAIMTFAPMIGVSFCVPGDVVKMAFLGALIGAGISLAVVQVSLLYTTTFNDPDNTNVVANKAEAILRALAHTVVAVACAVLFLIL